MSKLIPTVLLVSILAISFSLITYPNVVASQVWESSIAQFTYPDNWNIVQIIGNGEGISLQPFNEPNLYMHKTVYQDSADSFGILVDNILQSARNNGFETSVQVNVPGEVVISESTTSNGMYWIGDMHINQIPNDNDVVVTEYVGESSKYQQFYNDNFGFFVLTYLSPKEAGMNQNLIDKKYQLQMDISNEMYKTNMDIIDNIDGDNDFEWVN